MNKPTFFQQSHSKVFSSVNGVPVVDKEIVKEQARRWNYAKIQDLITKTNKIEFEVKKNPNLSTILVMNFILESVS